jgi:hypothetical protein
MESWWLLVIGGVFAGGFGVDAEMKAYLGKKSGDLA